MAKRKMAKTTSARRISDDHEVLLDELKAVVLRVNEDKWLIGDMVSALKRQGVSVKKQAKHVKESAQRLREIRFTAESYEPRFRRPEISFGIHTMAARSASRIGLVPHEVIDLLLEAGVETVREATRFLDKWKRAQDAKHAVAWGQALLQRSAGLWGNCHQADFRDCFRQIEHGTVKLVVADPPYGAYGRNTNGNPLGTSKRLVTCDGMDDESARALHRDLFEKALPLMRAGGCLIICRPGGHFDPPWLINMAADTGWDCKHACGWRRGSPKLGNGSTPYTTGTERLLIFSRQGEDLRNHDGSSRDDIFEVPQTRRTGDDPKKHPYGKPVELMERLISKHTFPGETVVEPFGASGPAARAAIRLQRNWLYSEINDENYKIGADLIAQELAQVEKTVA